MVDLLVTLLIVDHMVVLTMVAVEEEVVDFQLQTLEQQEVQEEKD